MKRWILAIFLFGTLAFAQNPTSPSYKSYLATASGADVAINQIGTGLDFHKLTWNVVGSVSTCSVQVDTSSDGISWSGGAAVGSQTCTSSGSSSVSSATANYVRINVTAFSGTGSVLILYQGYNNNPGGGSGTTTNQVLNQISLGGSSSTAVGGTVANGLTGQVLQSTNAAAPTFVSPGLPWGNGSAAVTATPYAVACDSGTAVADRGTTILFQSGASVINLPDPTAAGCTGNFAVSLYDDGAGTLTVNRGGTSTINVLDGTTNTDGATSFTLATGQAALCNANAAGTIWACRKLTGGSGTPVNKASQTALGANVAATNVIASATAGYYLVDCEVILTRAATTSSTLPSCSIIATDETGLSHTFAMSNTSTANTVGTMAPAATPPVINGIQVQAATAIQYSTTGYITSGATSMQYTVRVLVQGPF